MSGSKQNDEDAPPEAPPLSTGKRWFLNILAVVLSLFVVLAGSEILVRVYKKMVDIPSVLTFRKNPHGTGSYRLKGNVEGVTRAGGKLIEIKTNSHGMGWREVSLEKPPGVDRIAFVGDSFTYGLWATTIEKTFVGVFDSRLSDHGYETLNFGVSGYGLGDIELQIKEEVIRFKPDVIFLMFYGGNDFIDTYLGIDKYDVIKGKLIPNKQNLRDKVPAALRPGDKPGESPGLLKRWKRVLKSNSTLYRILSRKRSRKLQKEFKVGHNFTSRSFWSQDPYPEIAEEAKRVSLETLKRIHELCEREGIRLIIASIPFKEQVYSINERGDNYDINLPQRFVEEFSRDRRIPYLDLLPAARAHVQGAGKDIYVLNELHFNDEGHRVVGLALARWFESL